LRHHEAALLQEQHTTSDREKAVMDAAALVEHRTGTLISAAWWPFPTRGRLPQPSCSRSVRRSFPCCSCSGRSEASCMRHLEAMKRTSTLFYSSRRGRRQRTSQPMKISRLPRRTSWRARNRSKRRLQSLLTLTNRSRSPSRISRTHVTHWTRTMLS